MNRRGLVEAEQGRTKEELGGRERWVGKEDEEWNGGENEEER